MSEFNIVQEVIQEIVQKVVQEDVSEMNYGIIIHYGLYSYYGYDDINSVKRRKTQNGSEWYYGRLVDNNNFRPISGHKSTKKHHKETYGESDYFDNLDKITNDENKVKEWVSLAKNKGASYIILTSKHHDGVLLFDSKTSSLKSQMNICRVFSDECKKQNIKFGFYYSWFEFGVAFTQKYFKNYCVPQLEELIEYEPNYMWFDGDWKITQKTIQKEIRSIVEVMKTNNILVNDRIGKNNYDVANYRVFSDRYIPKEKLDGVKWQHINTIGYSWGYNKMQNKSDYKSKDEIYYLYNQINNLGGTFLINLGPNENAEIVEEELEALDFKILRKR
jgi:alpha-L-fucosidase